MEGSEYLQRLLRHCAGTPAVVFAAVAGPAAGDRFAEIDLYLTATGELLPGWLAPVGEAAYADSNEVITEDGLTIRVHVGTPAPANAQVLFDRGSSPVVVATAGVLPDLAKEAAEFWRDLYQACAAIGREQPFTAHGRLERCRERLLFIYRVALRPTAPGAGWEGAESLPGADRVLGPIQEWVVQPLEQRAQWRCAHRLAEAYETLMLPLAERLSLAYPWAMRNLTFRRLGEIRPQRGQAPDVTIPRLRDTADEAAPARKGGPGRFRVKPRGREE